MGRVAVVTGGASGIGLAIVRRLAAGGASVALLDLDADAADRAAAELRGEGLRVIGLAADVSDRAAVEKALEAARAEFGPVEIMVTSAGLSLNAPVPRHHRRGLGARAGGQPDRHVPLPPAGGAGHDRGRVGTDRHHLVVERAVGVADPGALLGVEGRRGGADQDAGAGTRPVRDHREHDPAPGRRHPHVHGRAIRPGSGRRGDDQGSWPRGARSAGWACPRTSRPPRPSCAPTTPATSPGRSSASTAATTPDPSHRSAERDHRPTSQSKLLIGHPAPC